jgi:hypothetical protein
MKGDFMHRITLYELSEYPRSMFGNLEVEIIPFKPKSTHNEIVKDLLGPIAKVGDVIKGENVVLKVITILFKAYENSMQGVLV